MRPAFYAPKSKPNPWPGRAKRFLLAFSFLMLATTTWSSWNMLYDMRVVVRAYATENYKLKEILWRIQHEGGRGCEDWDSDEQTSWDHYAEKRPEYEREQLTGVPRVYTMSGSALMRPQSTETL